MLPAAGLIRSKTKGFCRTCRRRLLIKRGAEVVWCSSHAPGRAEGLCAIEPFGLPRNVSRRNSYSFARGTFNNGGPTKITGMKIRRSAFFVCD